MARIGRKAQNPFELQQGLFTTEQAPVEILAKDREEFTRDELLSGELKSLGTFISGHPCDLAKAKFAGRITHGCGDDHGMIEYPGKVVIIGMVAEVIPRGRIYWIKLQDETGEAFLLCFSDEFERYRFALNKWDIIAVEVDIRKDPSRSPTLRLAKAHRVGRFVNKVGKV